MSLTPSLTGSCQLASHEVHSWSASLDVRPETFARLYATLACDERDRSARFRFERDRQQFIVAHGVLRDVLGRYLRTNPRDITFAYDAFGKPDLSPVFGSRLKFNLSHSAGLALIAIAADCNVGVDLECIGAQCDYVEIARHLFSAVEVNQLLAVPSHLYAEAFLNCWTKKEAYLKARGEGLAIPLNSFSVPLTTDSVHTLTDWSLFTLQPHPGYIGALAIEGSDWRLRQRQWPPGSRRTARA